MLNKHLRINGHDEEKQSEGPLVQVEWKMQLVLNKSVTVTETTEIIPKHVDIDRFKHSEQELERKMVIQSVVDPASDELISLNEAVKLGIVDYASGTYNDRQKNEQMTIDEAILRGLIQVEFVAMNTGEEKHKSFGTIKVEDAGAKSLAHYVVYTVINRKSGEHLDFDTVKLALHPNELLAGCFNILFSVRCHAGCRPETSE